MATVDRWLLPDGIEEVLPPEAARIEVARRQVLDLFQGWGYEFVVTPHIEYLESLLTGAGQDLVRTGGGLGQGEAAERGDPDEDLHAGHAVEHRLISL